MCVQVRFKRFLQLFLATSPYRTFSLRVTYIWPAIQSIKEQPYSYSINESIAFPSKMFYSNESLIFFDFFVMCFSFIYFCLFQMVSLQKRGHQQRSLLSATTHCLSKRVIISLCFVQHSVTFQSFSSFNPTFN